MNEVVIKAKKASDAMHSFFPTTEQKNAVLLEMADALDQKITDLLQANSIDLERGRQAGTSKALLDRLALTPERIQAMAQGLREITQLPDPIGDVLERIERPNGLTIEKKRVPLGVIGMIYEARPNVTVDSAGLCLKSGNAVILRGGSSAVESNMKIVAILHEAMSKVNFPIDYLQFIEDTDRQTVQHLLTCKEFVDVLIPRGGHDLIQHVVEHATVPIIETGEGVCHVYIHEAANAAMAQAIVINAKHQRPSVCNAIETVLIDQKVAEKQLPSLVQALQDLGVEVRGCQQSLQIVPSINAASAEDWATEYLDNILSIKVVGNFNEATTHIKDYGTKHSECIVTDDVEAAVAFMNQVDAAAVYHNASTRFTDGSEFGFGAEIGISTQKLHARGPMGLRELTSTKYFVHGTGQIRA